MTYRRFAEAHEEIADEWLTQPETVEYWTLGPQIGRGEAGSFHATSDKGCRAACKPAFSPNGVPRAAHERIAFDIARALLLPVPAVCLWTDPATKALYSISAWAFAQALTWGEVAGRLSAAFIQNAAPTFSAMRVFHSWIGDTDHNGNPGNVVVDAESNDTHPAVAFIDHAFSMTHSADFQTQALAALPVSYIPPALLDPDATRAMVEVINDLDSNLIEDAVRRIPNTFLPPERGTAIMQGLMKRKVELAPVFGVSLV
jgi:hypothetical protein